jgi:PAS domain S-box-containing protein
VFEGERRATRFIGTAIDLTERKRAEEALRREEERLRIAKSAARLGIYDHNLVTGGVGWDERLRELWGVGSESPITYELFMAGLVPEDRAPTQAAIDRAMDPAGDGKHYVEYRVRNARDNRVRWIAATGQVSFAGRRPVRVVGTVQDITQRKEFQAELERLVAERTTRLQEMVGELEHFSYTITHDLKSPLRAMRGFAELASMMCGDGGPKEVTDALAKISTAAERMDGLIADALSYSRSMRQELPLTDVDTGALLRGMLDSYPELQPSKARIRVEGRLPLVLGTVGPGFGWRTRGSGFQRKCCRGFSTCSRAGARITRGPGSGWPWCGK